MSCWPSAPRASNDEFLSGTAGPIANLNNKLATRAIAAASGGNDEE